jgi:hypothetical protein
MDAPVTSREAKRRRREARKAKRQKAREAKEQARKAREARKQQQEAKREAREARQQAKAEAQEAKQQAKAKRVEAREAEREAKQQAQEAKQQAKAERVEAREAEREAQEAKQQAKAERVEARESKQQAKAERVEAREAEREAKQAQQQARQEKREERQEARELKQAKRAKREAREALQAARRKERGETQHLRDIMERERAFASGFDTTDLSPEEISNVRKARRRQFRDELYGDMSVEELAELISFRRDRQLKRQDFSDVREIEADRRAYIHNFDTTGFTERQIRDMREKRAREFRRELRQSMSKEDFREYQTKAGFLRESELSEEEFLEAQVQRKERSEARQRQREAEEVVMSVPQRRAVQARRTKKVKLAEEIGITEKQRPESFRGIEPKRARTLRTVVKPEFQRARHVDTMVQEMAALNPTQVTPSMLAQASQLSNTPVTGRTFFPPQNANPTIVHPWTARFTPPSRPMPTYMNWADTANVAAVRGWKLPRSRLSRAKRVSTDTKGFLHEVVDQLGCGSCWSVSVAGAMSDRVSIWSQEENPQLSITNILGCVSGDGTEGEVVDGASLYSPATAGCAGGIPTGAVEMLANFGDAAASCVGYQWCENDPVCNQSKRLGFSDAPEYLNSIIPACAEMLETCIKCKNGECEASDRARTVWGLETYPSGRPYILLTDPLSIQQEIAAHGPVVATYAIYGDFQNGTAAILGDGWAKTNGVYCNVQSGRRPYSGTRYAGSERQMIGYHAVVIVGWGLERGVPDWQNPGATLDIPYWIVRNSWGTQWNEACMVNGINMPGHCKFAIIDRARDINTKTYLDTADDGLIGAALSFRPKVMRVEPPLDKPPQVDVDPVMHEDKMETSGEVQLAAAVDEVSEDEDGMHRLNQPILCNDTTPATIRAVNCRLHATKREASFVQWLPLIVLGVVTVTILVVLVLKMKRK